MKTLPVYSTRHAAFTLMEMAIVLLIIGLIIGGIAFGRSLLVSAELRAIMTEYQDFKTAYSNFRTKYKYWPGDLPDANILRGSANPTSAGNGDDKIGAADIGNAQAPEMFYAWQHLQIAGMINGNYSGVAGSGGTDHAVPGTNVPMSRMAGNGWGVRTFADPTTTAAGCYFPATSYGINLFYGKQTATNDPVAPAITPEQADEIDNKIDDGRPAIGKVTAPMNGCAAVPACTTTAVDTTAVYNLSSTNVVCSLIFPKVVEP